MRSLVPAKYADRYEKYLPFIVAALSAAILGGMVSFLLNRLGF